MRALSNIMQQICLSLLHYVLLYSFQSRVLDVIMSLYPQVSVSDPASVCVHVLLLWEHCTVLMKVLVTMPALANVPPGCDAPFARHPTSQ